MRRRIFIILTIAWMIVIFAFSAKDANESEKASYRVGLTIGHIFIADFEEMSEEKQIEFARMVDHPIRKTAHGLEYTLLGFLIMGIIYSSSMRWYLQILIAWGATTLYASTDEFHQLFVAGRSGEIRDVCIDSIGALVGVIIGYAVLKSYYKRKSTQQK